MNRAPQPDMLEPPSELCTADGPKLAVVISCYNYELFVERAIQSVLHQGRHDCEVVVVDDGSTDGSWDAISRYDVKAFKIDNSGQVAACRYGFDRTRAPFVLFLDADDELKPGALATIIGLLEPSIAKLQFGLTRIDADGNPTGGRISLEAFRSRDELLSRVLRSGVYKSPPTSGNVFRRDLCEFLRKADYDTAVDGVILFAAPLLGDVLSLSEELGCYRVHGRNKSGLGRIPDVPSLERNLRRFVLRMKHLREIVDRLKPDAKLVSAEEAFYFRERALYIDLVSGRRPGWKMLRPLLSSLMREPFATRHKFVMTGFFLLLSLLPSDKGRALLAYRLDTGRRSFLGFIQALIGFSESTHSKS